MLNIKGRSIMVKILLMILAICIFESFLFTFMSNNLSEKSLTSIINENSIKNAALYSEYISNWLTERMREIEIYANTPIVRTLDWEKIGPYLKNEVSGRLNIYDDFIVAGLDGNYNTTLKRNVGNASDREYFQAAIEGRTMISNPVISRTNGMPVAVVAAPIKNDNDEVIGVMAGTINLFKLSNIIENLKYNYPDSYSYIVDKTGLIIAHPNKEYILKENISVESDIITTDTVEASGHILNNDIGSVAYTFNNISSMSYYQAIPNTDNWKLVIKIPVEYWHAPIRHSFISHIQVGIAGLLFAAVLGFFVAKGISDPIIWLRSVFIKAAEGDLTIRSAIDSDDEIGDASRSFNKMMDKISRLTYYDPLTHLPNRMLFAANLDMELERAAEQNKGLAVLVLDLDKFESINNTLGHAAGDKLLKSLSEKLRVIVDHNHVVSHMGEDRFAIMLKDCKNKQDAIQLANVIRSVIKQPWVVDEQSFYITACIGISFYPEDGSNGDSLFKNAFSAMQKAKRRGRDSIELYEPSINARLLEQLNLDSSMHQALDNGEFLLHYQPQIDTVTKEIVGCEALIRWKHPELGMISPLSFIPVAEANGLIISIGRWVLYTACKQNKQWQDSGMKPIYVSVNLSAAQLIQEDFPDMVAEVLAVTGLSPEYLELEITESVAVKNPEYITEILHKLRNMGVRIALDDFGTGYSSLNYLKNFAITTLKIDRSFISDINDNPKNAAIVSTILAMGHNLKLKVTAEGVESCEQYEILRRKGCDTIQGYYFSKPLPPHQFEEYVKKLGDS